MKTFRLTFALFILLSTFTFCYGQVAGGTLVSTFIDDTKKAIQDILNDTDFMVSKNSFEIRQHLLLVEDNLEKVGNGLLDKTFDQLDDKVRLTFNQMNNTVNNFDIKAAGTLNKLDETIGNLNDALSTIPGSKAQPRILKYTPNAVGSSWNSNLVFKGSFLGKAKKLSLDFNGVKCKLVSNTENQMIFEYPQALKNSKSVDKLYGDLNFEYKAGLFSKTKKISYKVLVFNIPDKFGNYNLEAKVDGEEMESFIRNEEYNYRNEHCSGTKNQTSNVNAREGWMIDLESIEVAVDKTQNSQFNGIFDKTKHGFQLRGSVANSGSCGKVFGHIVSYDARGSLKLKVTFKEYRIVPKISTKQVQAGDLLFGNKIKIDLPEKTKQFTIFLTDINGKQHVISDTNNSEMYDIEYFPIGSYITIGIKDIKQIF
ncbi:hypothetical protein [Chryseobacterium pennae]|nr:hypothetical protein [Chryseobacterium pennae]